MCNMDNLEILKELFDQKILNILKMFLQDKEKQFYLREISKLSDVPVATTYRIINRLVTLGFVQETQISKFKVYQLGKSEKARFLEDIFRKGADPLQVFVDKMKSITGISKILLEEKKDNSAKLLFVGDSIPSKKIEELCKETKKSSNIEINFLVLASSQFEKMTEIGLYAEKDKVLWKKP